MVQMAADPKSTTKPPLLLTYKSTPSSKTNLLKLSEDLTSFANTQEEEIQEAKRC